MNINFLKKKIEKCVIFLLVTLSFSNLFGYLDVVTSSSLNPLKLYIICLALTFLLMMVRPSSFKYIFKLPLYRWMLFYFIVILIWIMLPNSYANAKDMRGIILPIIILFIFSTLMYFDDKELSTTRNAFFIVTLIAITINIVEFFIPTLLFSQGTQIIGRSAGFHIDANESSEGIVLGLIFSYGIVKEKLKTLFLFAAFLGIIVTFSRSGMASWFLTVIIFSLLKIINKKTILVSSSILFLSFLVLLPKMINYIDNETGDSNLIARISFNSSTIQDHSSNQRLEIAERAIGMFADNPLIGSGLFSTKYWDLPVSPHNTYFKLMAEFGIVGLIIFISLIITCVWKAKNEAKKISIVFILYILMIGFASHNVINFPHFLIAFALMASMSYKSRVISSA